MTTSTLAQRKLTDALRLHAGRTLFLYDDGRQFSYDDAVSLSETAAFSETRRRLVFCMCENDPGGMLGYLGLLAADAVPLMLSTKQQQPQFEGLLAAYQPAFVWLPQERAADVGGGEVVFSHLGYCLVATNRQQDYQIHESLALLLSTSGSTGSPKFVRLSHENLLSNAESIATYLALRADDLPITTLPPSYTYGLSIIHSHLLLGCTIALTSQTFFDRGFWDFLKQVGATSFGGVPYHYEMLKKLRFSGMELPSLRTLTQAGGQMAPELTREFAGFCASRKMRFFTMYGQAEATARMSYLDPEKVQDKAGSIGQPIPGGLFWLEDEQGTRLDGTDVVGELVYQGKNVSMGYAEGRQDLARGDELGGVLRTGDMARRDAEGDYYIVGRLKRFLKMFGHRVNLQDVENTLLADGYAVACGGQDNQLEVYVPQGTPEMATAIKSRLVNLLKLSPGAIRVLEVADLPRNDAGKVQYALLPERVVKALA